MYYSKLQSCYVLASFFSFLLITLSCWSSTFCSSHSIVWLAIKTIVSFFRLAILLAVPRELFTRISDVLAAPPQKRWDWCPGLRNFEVPGTLTAKPVKNLQWGLLQESWKWTYLLGIKMSLFCKFWEQREEVGQGCWSKRAKKWWRGCWQG